MLEFLKEIDTQLYNRAQTIQHVLFADSVVGEIQNFFHIAFKKIYKLTYKIYNFNIRDVRNPKDIELNPTLRQFINNIEFRSYLQSEIDFNDFTTLSDLNSKENTYKHDDIINTNNIIENEGQQFTEEEKDRYFKCLFDFSLSYYKFKTGQLPKEKWDINQYKKLKDNNTKLVTNKNDIDDSVTKIDDFIKSLSIRKSDIIKKQLEEEAPNCKVCGKKMVLRSYNDRIDNSLHFLYGCPSYSKDVKHPAVYKLNEQLVEEYKKALEEEHIKKIIRTTNIKDNRNTTELLNYKNINHDINQNRFFFQSVALPYSLFNDRIDNNLYEQIKQFSRFSVTTNLNKEKVDYKYALLYNLILRILNRGTITKEPQYVEDELYKKFGDGSCYVNDLFDYIDYINPYFITDSKNETEFLNKDLRNIFGKSWASYILTQCPFEIFDKDRVEQRIDFLICKNNKTYAIELDGKEHKYHMINDNNRVSILEKYNIQSIRVENKFIGNAKEKLQKLDDLKTKQEYGKLPYTKRLLAANKIIHQIEIALVKMLLEGVIKTQANLSFDISSKMYSNDEKNFIFNIALQQTKNLIENIANIYDIKVDINFSNKESIPVKIFIGDGNIMQNGIIIRDISLPIDFMCKIDTFNTNILPCKIEEKSVVYFLKYIFGFDKFREGQFDAISRLLLKKDSIILLPTGSGKSIIYQLSSLLAPGLIIVVSPLKALMKDQIENLHYNGIDNAIAIYYEKNNHETDVENIIYYNNNLSLIYLAPERLIISNFRKRIDSSLLQTFVFSVALDEAHCISEWGHDFRIAYLDVGEVSRKIFEKKGKIPSIFALTGTASDAVVKDIKRILKINDSDAILRPKNFNRAELKFSLIESNVNDKTVVLSSVLKNYLPREFNISKEEFFQLKGNDTYSGIVFAPYVNTNKNEYNEHYSTFFINSQLKKLVPECIVEPYSSTPPKDVDQDAWASCIQQSSSLFKQNKINLLVSTKAYGMGIDKKNIRYVIHNGIPMSLEQYYQEAGRAGRDGSDSKCIIIFTIKQSTIDADIFNPSNTLEKVREIYEKKLSNSQYDDLIAMMFFHLSSFPGIEPDIKKAKKVIELLDVAKTCQNNKIVTKTITNNFFGSYSEDTNKDIQIVIFRLITLGIIKEYTYDYAKQEFNIMYDSLDKQEIVNHYVEYVRNYNIGRYAVEKKKIEKIDLSKGNEAIIDCISLLISFIYENIETGRRRAMQSMYELALNAAKIEDDSQDAFIRDEIVNYFNVENANIIGQVIDDKKAGLKTINKLFEFNKKSETSLELLEKANSLRGEATRSLESYPDHPGLLLIKSISEILTNNANHEMIINNILSSYEFSVNKYNIPQKEILNLLIKIINLTNNKDIKLYYELKKDFKSKYNKTYIKLRNQMINSDDINDNLRDDIMVEYFDDTITKYMEGN